MNIEQIELYIPNYEESVSFYKHVLAFDCVSETAETAHFQVGSSRFTLHRDEEHAYYYHFAFNIPPNLFSSAKQWIAKKVPLLTEDGADEIYFDGAKAHAFYFEDPAGNIVEYIARTETTPEAAADQFAPCHIAGVSEMGVPTNETKKQLDELLDLGIPPRNNEPLYYEKYLNFMGEYEDGNYLIIGPVGRRWIFSNKPGIIAPVIVKTDRGTIRNF
ncbi:hypothetical protein ACP2W0_09185 [Pseudobacillus badius]|uniref:hypothetical protein n=1 Tax=Bacillus badius TaxID=1455 RepID=UPI0007B07911|nr:hypothetical protein [Bacillus badius]KZN99713.1 hypothetical protein A4244_17095 [Bacillus badius]MED0666498.1 hypothetical protein [Bacillus badius]OCS85817.1 hypothetical protein A6M11_17110 [Bacillus badius]OVE51825.1 hypothetical protein B1A98_09720 [Bacillus badius]TDW03251.1 hypothetical protein B0G66_104157 [Bacillus badius]